MAWQQIRRIPIENPIIFGVTFSTVKTSFSDLLVQTQFEKRGLADIDWRRNSAFALFGCFYLGGVQYALYVPGFGRLFPKAAEFATKPFKEKLKDPVGWRNMLSQVFLDQCVHHPLMYFPVFYSLKEVVAGGSAWTGLMRFRENYKEDMVALWKVWVPATIINFTFSPMWLRIPFVASTSLIWTVILSAMRGSNDIITEEESTDIVLNQGREMDKLLKSHALDGSQDNFLFSAHGQDRVGLVHSLAATCARHGGSISESKMVRMGGQFMVMMVISIDPSISATFRAEIIQSLGDTMEVSIQDISDQTRNLSKLKRTRSNASTIVVGQISVQGNDRPGIVADVTRLLANKNLNIERMETKVLPANGLDPAVFEMLATVHSYQELNPLEVQSAAKSLESELGVSFSIEFQK